MIVLANRPGFPFLGNDFFGSLGKSFFSQTEDLSLQLFCRLLSGSPFTCVPSLWRWWRTAQQVSNFKIIEVPRFSPLLNAIFNTTRLTILLRHKLWISVLFPRVFLLASSTYLDFDWFILSCSLEWYRVPQVLVSSFDWFIFFSMALVTGPDGRRWPEYETLLRATPPKLNTSCNVFGWGVDKLMWASGLDLFPIAQVRYIKMLTWLRD